MAKSCSHPGALRSRVGLPLASGVAGAGATLLVGGASFVAITVLSSLWGGDGATPVSLDNVSEGVLLGLTGVRGEGATPSLSDLCGEGVTPPSPIVGNGVELITSPSVILRLGVGKLTGGSSGCLAGVSPPLRYDVPNSVSSLLSV